MLALWSSYSIRSHKDTGDRNKENSTAQNSFFIPTEHMQNIKNTVKEVPMHSQIHISMSEQQSNLSAGITAMIGKVYLTKKCICTSTLDDFAP